MSVENIVDQAGPRAPIRGPRRTAERGVLWSAETARDIVVALIEDVEDGLLAPGEATDLIARVWARAAPVPHHPVTPRGAGSPVRGARRLEPVRHRTSELG